MEELYFITVLGNIKEACNLSLIASFLISCLFLNYFVRYHDNKKVKKYAKILVSVTIASCLCSIFIPTTNQLYAIYGIGSVVDYVKDNKDAKKIPDKAVKYIIKYFEDEQKKGEI